MSARRLSIGDRAVAFVALSHLIDQALTVLGQLDAGAAGQVAEELLARADGVQYKPNTQRLVLTFDLSGPVLEVAPPVSPPVEL